MAEHGGRVPSEEPHRGAGSELRPHGELVPWKQVRVPHGTGKSGSREPEFLRQPRAARGVARGLAVPPRMGWPRGGKNPYPPRYKLTGPPRPGPISPPYLHKPPPLRPLTTS